jgi:UTP-glucose-1-phosphate uridylyltransferase
MAAGISSRYGGLKQVDPVGPGGEAIIDYSIYDAIRAGFSKVVIVIRRDIEVAFRETISKTFEDKIAVEYAYQELNALPEKFIVAPNRQKPWGTGHAVWVAKEMINEPFAAINADDFYGRTSFKLLSDYLTQRPTSLETSADSSPANYAMVGFTLRNTLSDFGAVSRGVCQSNDQNFLQRIVEYNPIEKDGDGAKHFDQNNQIHSFSGDEIVSMNAWGFTPVIFDQLQAQFVNFLRAHGREQKSEFFLPTAVTRLIPSGQARVKVLPSTDQWFGITYQGDKPHVINKIKKLIDQGTYPERLWG